MDDAVLLDLDGTLIDSVFHHVIAWDASLRRHGYEVPQWRIHAGLGMGSKRLVPWLLGGHVEDAEAVIAAHGELFSRRVADLAPTPGACALLEDLDRRGVPHLIATSARADMRRRLLEKLGRSDLPALDAEAIEHSKPAPDLLLEGCRQLGVDPQRATMVGDAPWDAEAARRIGMRCLAVRCGGFGDGALLAAGATAVVDDPRALIGRL